MKLVSLTAAQDRLHVYAFFVVAMFALGRVQPAIDLSADYIACRQAALGQWSQIYLHHGPLFGAVMSPERWSRMQHVATAEPYLSDYIQTPAFAWALQPICRTLDWRGFVALNALVEGLSLAATAEIVARRWAPRFLSPIWMTALLAGVLCLEPTRAGLSMGQIPFLMLLFMVAALATGGKDKAAAGLALSLPAAVKLEPGALVFHLVAARRWRAVAAFAAASAALVALGASVGGLATFTAYLDVLRGISNNVVVMLHDQSLAAALTPASGAALERSAAAHPDFAPWLRWLSAAATIGSAVVGGLVARREGREAEGACISLVGVTMFAPLAWDQYFVTLVPALMVLLQRARPWRWAAALLIFALAALPLSAFQSWSPAPHLAFRSLFVAGVVALVALACAARGGAPTPEARS